MSSKNHRRRRHAHVLDRLRERYDHTATAADVIRLCDAAAERVKAGQHYGSVPGTDGIHLYLDDPQLGRVHAIYIPRHQALATVLPPDSRGGNFRGSRMMPV